MNATKLWNVILAAVLIAFLEHVGSSPAPEISTVSDTAVVSAKEVNDLNKPPMMSDSKDVKDQDQKSEDLSQATAFDHYDEDQQRGATNLNTDQSMKYDVEILEVRDIKQENTEIEERFRGPAIKMDTDNFVAENIEVNGGEDAVDASKPNHIMLTIGLIFAALLSVSLYAALVIWRASLEQRYAMRELLVNTDDDFYRPSGNGAQQVC